MLSFDAHLDQIHLLGALLDLGCKAPCRCQAPCAYNAWHPLGSYAAPLLPGSQAVHLYVQVLKHPEFLTGKATTSFIGDNPQLFEFGAGSEAGGQSSKVLQFLADQVS